MRTGGVRTGGDGRWRSSHLRVSSITSARLRSPWAAETADRTVHAVMHVGWVPDETGGYRGRMAVLVKPNGLSGAACMAAIKPFRYLVVYPALFRAMEREWQARRLGIPRRTDGAR